MRNKVALGFLALMVWLLPAANAWAVALGKIDVASHLGERFYAEVPLQLDPGESVSNVYVELASPADYRILEIYRDPALDAIQVDVKTDSRGSRVVLSSDTAVNAPFFNLVLKLRYQRATHFKKYPVFLDIPKVAKPAKVVPLPTVKQGQQSETGGTAPSPAPAVAVTTAPSKPVSQKPGSTFTPFDGWARTSRYGPMVYGDTITTVAQRLQIDKRYTRQQVMVALFEKNRARFDHDNINLIKAGTFLDVPTAAEVERISPEEARSIIAKQEKVWKQLIKQPKYAAIAEAQKHRYSKRVRVGERAGGVASAPMSTAQGKQGSAIQTQSAVQTVQKGAAATSAATAAAMRKQSELQQQLQQLQQQNTDLQNKLAENQKQLAAASAQPSGAAAAAAASARIKKLQIQLARMQAQRDEALQKARSQPSPLGWLTYALLAVIVLLLALIGFLMRRERTHPAAEYAMPEPRVEPEHYEPSPDMFEDAPEIDVEEVPELDTTATMQMNAADVTKEFTDSIPDLTDEDTGKMEAFREEIEEEPDPNVDYLAEADVYLRYGMEDEAVQQVKMALKLDPHNPEAHVKMVQVLKAKNDESAVDEAMAAARQSLGGDALNRFEDAVSTLEQAVDSFGDTLPPTLAEELVEFHEDMSSEGVSEEDTLVETELPAKEEKPAAETKSEEDEVDAAMSALEGLSGEWPEFEDTETSLQEAESEVSPQPAVEATEEPETVEKPAAAPSEEMVSGGKEFDLSDIEIPDTEIEAAGDEASRARQFMDTSDLEKTVAIDWSKDTSVDTGDHEEIISESGANAFEDTMTSAEMEMQIGQEPEVPAESEPEAAPEPESAPASAIDEGIDLGDFDFDQTEREEAVESTSDDEFSSTIRTTLAKIDDSAGDDGGLDFDLSAELESDQPSDMETTQPPAASDEPKKDDDTAAAKSAEDTGDFLLDLDEDLDATQKLDSLLSEFSDESEKDGGDKKKP